MRIFGLLVCLVGLFHLASVSEAQTGLDPYLPEGDQGWCDPGGNPGGCGFASATAACENQTRTNYPNGNYVSAGAKNETSTTATCALKKIPGIPGLFIGSGIVTRECDDGYQLSGNVCTYISAPSTCNDCTTYGALNLSVGNPIEIATGAKRESVIDYSSADGRLKFKREYNSLPYGYRSGAHLTNKLFGYNWGASLFPTLRLGEYFDATWDMTIFLADGGSAFMARDSFGPNFITDNYILGKAVAEYTAEFEDNLGETSPSQAERKVLITHSSGIRYHFDTPKTQRGSVFEGVLRSVDYPGGYSLFYEYHSDGSLIKITDTFDRSILFEYNIASWILYDDLGNVVEQQFDYSFVSDQNIARDPTVSTVKKITFPDQTYVEFDYDAIDPFDIKWGVNRRLIKATRYDASDTVIKSEQYHYDDQYFEYALTGITDSSGIRYADWTYGPLGRAISSEHAGGVDKFNLDYGTNRDQWRATFVTVTNPLGRESVYSVDGRLGEFAISAVDGAATQNVLNDRMTYDYGAVGLNNTGLKSIVDRRDNSTNYTRDARGRVLTKTQAAGTAEEFTTTKSYEAEWQQVEQTVTPGLTTDYVYDNLGRMTSMTMTDTTPQAGPTRTWTYTYAGPNVTSVDGPLFGASDTYSFEYVGEKLTKVTNPLGQETRITNHNPIGAPLRIIDPNNVVTNLTYDSRHRLTRIYRLGVQTQITYNDTDQITFIRPPNGAYHSFIYDDARRLRYIQNKAGERILFTRNPAGGVTRTRIGTIGDLSHYDMSTVRDELNRVIEAIGVGATAGGGARSYYGYDKEDNLTSVTDNETHLWQRQFDSLNRLIKETDPIAGETDLGREAQSDGRNDITSITDPRDVTTNYVLNGFGEVMQEISLEAGTTTYTRDQRGLVTSMIDGRGVISDYIYDDMGRLTDVTYPSDPSLDITYTYDENTYGIGNLTTVFEDFGTTTYDYDSLGFMTGMTRDIDGQSYTTNYTHDNSGQVESTTYPSGASIEYTWDAAGRIKDIDLTETSIGTVNIAQNIRYKAFGPVRFINMGDGHNLSITYDQNYRAMDFIRNKPGSGALMNLDFEYDGRGNILSLTDNIRSNRSWTYNYDELSRLTDATDAAGTFSYSYNAGGDRESRDFTGIGYGTQEDYTYDPLTYRLQTVSFTDAMGASSLKRQFAYDDAGYVTGDTRTEPSTGDISPYTYSINDRGRIESVAHDGNAFAFYTYDEAEQRVAKTVYDMNGATSLHFHYDDEGRLIAESDGDTGSPIRDYVWFGLTPLAVLDYTGPSPELSYLHADHLGRPQFATDTSGSVIWDMGADVTPFGEGVNMAGAFAQKLMFPGQYADLETGLSHNWHRTYDPTLGRYLQSDPIGLAGGLNRYAYVGGNPMGWVDPMGLLKGNARPYQIFLETTAKQWRNPRTRTPWGTAWATGYTIGAGGALIHFYLRDNGDGCGGSDPEDDNNDDDPCYKRYLKEQNWCRYRPKIWQPACLNRATVRWDLCNRRVPQSQWPREWSINDER